MLSSYWQINWQIYPCPQLSIDALHTVTPNLTDLPQINWQIYTPHIKHRCLAYCYTKLGRSTPLIKHRCLEYCLGTAHIGRSTGRSTPHIIHLVAKNGNCRFVLLKLILADELADLPPVDLPVHLNGHFWFLLLKLMQTDQLADLPSGTDI